MSWRPFWLIINPTGLSFLGGRRWDKTSAHVSATHTPFKGHLPLEYSGEEKGSNEAAAMALVGILEEAQTGRLSPSAPSVLPLSPDCTTQGCVSFYRKAKAIG